MLRISKLCILPCLLALLAVPAVGADQPLDKPTNLDLEEGTVGQVPDDWWAARSTHYGYTVSLRANDSDNGERCTSGERCASIVGDGDQGGFGNLMQSIDATAYRGKRVRLRGSVRTLGAGKAQMWLRVDRPERRRGFFDNMGDRPIVSASWQDVEIVGDVDADAEDLNFGLMFLGQGEAWFDAVSLEVVGESGLGNVPARALTPRGLENLEAFARLQGLVRFFHPSDEAADADWEELTLVGVDHVEPAADAQELAERLQQLFAPVAPGVEIATTPFAAEPSTAEPTTAEPSTAESSTVEPPAGATHYRVWYRLGYGTGSPRSVYQSHRLDAALEAPSDTLLPRKDKRLEQAPRPGEVHSVDLGGGVHARVPLTTFRDAEGTLPRATAEPVKSSKPNSFLAGGNDRSTRLSNVILAWNIFEHFYPYFDVVPGDWSATLGDSLRRAAEDPDAEAFTRTLEWLVADLHDGHGGVYGSGGTARASLPVLWDWVDGALIVTRVADDLEGVDLAPGDRVHSIDGRPVAEALEAVGAQISSPTPQWRRFRALGQLGQGSLGKAVELVIQRTGSEPHTIRLERSTPAEPLVEPRPEKISEVEPGVMYVDLDRVSTIEFEKAIPRLAEAKGLILDLRGYPRAISTIALSHLIDEPISSAQWHVPIVVRPNDPNREFRVSSWDVQPAEPRFRAKTVFLTDGRAISYAETYLGMVEHYHLAEIVGGPTAGTNGNVNPFGLPGGYQLTWTGMRVLKHDGSRHHGVGILPTVPVQRTRQGITEGRDEVLERGLELVRPTD